MSATGHHIAGAILLGAAVAAGPAQAQLPLSIEELLVEQRTLKLQTAFSYSNSDSSHQDLAPARLCPWPGSSRRG